LLTRKLKVGDHVLGEVTVLADAEVDVVGEDGAGIAGVAALRDHVAERGEHRVLFFGREAEEGKLESIRGALVERADLVGCGLDPLATVVESPSSAITSEAMYVDMLPRGSFGNHQPHAIQTRW
jgi:hypothetical protein